MVLDRLFIDEALLMHFALTKKIKVPGNEKSVVCIL